MKKTTIMLTAAFLLMSLCSCGGKDVKDSKDVKETADVPEIHAIAYDDSLDTLDDEGGADAFDHSLDHADSRYYRILDYYNMESDESLHILPHFETYQQTTEYSCACASS